jgi:putative PEP-CTERM system histidine kinase
MQSGFKVIPVDAIWAIEVLKNLSWCAFLVGLLLKMAQQRNAPTTIYRVMGGVVVVASLLLVFPDDLVPLVIFVDLRYLGQVVVAVAGMMMIEQVYRNTLPEQRWSIKYLCLGLGGMFAFDFYLFSDALLFKRIDADLWYARGGINTLIVPLLAVSAVRNPDWSLDLFVSRRVVFHTTTLLSAGIYMLLMAFAGYYIKLYGGEWGAVLQITFLFAAVMVLTTLLFSGQVRAQARVFFNKHFFNYRYDYREEWLRLIGLLTGQDTDTPLLERVIWALGEIVDSGGGILWLCSDRGDCQLAAQRNQPFPEVEGDPGLSSLTTFLKQTKWIVNLKDYQNSPEPYGELEVPGWLTAIEGGWLVVPLIHDEEVTGFVLLTNPRARIKLNWENLDLLKTAGRQAASYITLYKTAEALAEAKQFEGFNRLSAFVVHDLKNLIAQLSLVVRNAERHRNNPEFIDDAIQTIDNAVKKMNRLMAHLRSATPDDRRKRVELSGLLKSAVASKSTQRPLPVLEIDAGEIRVYADPDRLEAVIGHVIQNAQDATADSGEVRVALRLENGEAVVEVRDTGTGMDEQFIRERLFRPFDSTKGLTGMGIGAYESKEFVQAIGGRLLVSSTPGKGTIFKILLPEADTLD